MKLLIVLALAVAVSAANLDSVAHPGFPEGRIINGQAAEKGEAPFIVSLERNGAHFCGGSIIDEHHVLTAAHCLIYANEQVQVVAGLHSRNLQSDVQKRQATKQIKHADYGGGVGPNDIGLIYVAEAFNLNTVARDGSADVAKINAGSNKYEQAGNGVLYGWGRDNSGALPIDLQKLNADIIGYEACKKATNNTPSLAPTNICTFTPDKADGACNGDSGGPLIEKTSKGANLVGIVSWGWVPCASVKLPSVYTSVAAHLDWIEQNKVNSFIVEELL